MKKLVPSLFVSLLGLLPLNLLGQNYTLQDLGTLPADESYALTINNQNSILGFIKQAGSTRDFIWKANEGLVFLPHHYQLPLMNNHNQVTGIFWHKTNNWIFNNTISKHFYIYHNNAFLQDLGAPTQWKMQELQEWQTTSIWDKKDLEIVAFTDHQQILISNLDQNNTTKLVLWENGAFNDIDPSVIDIAYAMNNQGSILARKWVKHGSINVPMLVLYNPKEGICIEIMKDINLLRRKMNDLGQVIVFQVKESNGRGFLWDPNKGLLELEDFAPVAFNNCNQIVGFQMAALQNKKTIPLMWTSGEFVSLPQLGLNDAESLWSEVISLHGINDDGYIIGQGVCDGKKHAFVLVPSH